MGLSGVGFRWPGGMRDGCLLRFAQAEVRPLSAPLFQHGCSPQGAGRIQPLRAFARPGQWKRERWKREDARRKKDEGRGTSGYARWKMIWSDHVMSLCLCPSLCRTVVVVHPSAPPSDFTLLDPSSMSLCLCLCLCGMVVVVHPLTCE